MDKVCKRCGYDQPRHIMITPLDVDEAEDELLCDSCLNADNEQSGEYGGDDQESDGFWTGTLFY